MQLKYPSSDVDGPLHVDNLALLAARPWTLNRQQFLGTFPELFSGNENVFTMQATTASSPACMVWHENKLLVIIGGMTGNLQLRQLIVGWTTPLYFRSPPFGGVAFRVAAQDLEIRTRPISGVDWSEVTIIGYSFGGGTAMLLAALMRQRGYNPARMRVFTYGAPRCSIAEDAGLYRGMNVTRTWTTLDPVARCPPRITESPLLSGIAPRALRLGMDMQIQPNGGYELRSNGTLVGASAASAPIILHPIAIEAWLLGVNCFGAAEHSLETYRVRASMLPVSTPAQSGVRPPAPGDLSRSPDPAEQRRLIVTALTAEGIVTRTDTPAVINAAFAATPPLQVGSRYVRLTQYGVRMVAIDGNVVAVCNSRRQQTKVWHELNRRLP